MPLQFGGNDFHGAGRSIGASCNTSSHQWRSRQTFCTVDRMRGDFGTPEMSGINRLHKGSEITKNRGAEAEACIQKRGGQKCRAFREERVFWALFW